MDKIKFENALGEFKRHAELKKYTSIGLGGNATYLVEAKDLKQLINAVTAARNFAVPFRVIGYGSNILVSDNGFDGLIIINRANSIQVDKSKGIIIAEGGAALSKLILEAASNGLSGCESMFGIPGSVGGAICVNAGAHDESISKFLKLATIMLSSDKIVNVQNEWFEFGYRTSKMKYNKQEFPPLILSAIFQFQQRRTQNTLDEIAKFKVWREEHQPIGEKTCGSVFKNPSGSDNNEIKEKSAGYLLDQSGAKKFKKGHIHVSKKHANWIINDGNGTALEARQLIEQMRESVIEKFSLTLTEEIEYLGEWE
jgi:UDP-N-acetylmuramate dehydrogenase